MGCITTALPQPNMVDLLKLVGLPSRTRQSECQEELVGRANELVRTVGAVVEGLISTAIAARTSEEFISVRVGIFPQYFAAMRALGDLSAIVLPKEMIEQLSADWFCVVESEFRDRGPETFGSDLTERGMFTVWTLRKIRDLAKQVAFAHPPEGIDIEKAAEFATTAIWPRFHVDCLTTAMRDNKPIYPNVIEPIREGLRAAINTYACIRQLADGSVEKLEPELSPIEWDDEDELLLVDSMRDMERESV